MCSELGSISSEACVFRTKGNRDDIDDTGQRLKEDVELMWMWGMQTGWTLLAGIS